MDFSRLPLFRLVAQRLDYLAAREQVLTQNVANSDTPNYRARDLEQPSFAKELRSVGGLPLPAQRTHPGHIAARMERHGAGYRVTDSGQAEANLSGNDVNVEDELAKLAETEMHYQVATDVYRKYLGMFRTVIGRTGG